MATAYEPSDIAPPGMAGIESGEPAYEPRLKTLEPTAMKEPQRAQNMSSGGLGASQSQQVTLGGVDVSGAWVAPSGETCGGSGADGMDVRGVIDGDGMADGEVGGVGADAPASGG